MGFFAAFAGFLCGLRGKAFNRKERKENFKFAKKS
jgi:hypothetical protein